MYLPACSGLGFSGVGGPVLVEVIHHFSSSHRSSRECRPIKSTTSFRSSQHPSRCSSFADEIHARRECTEPIYSDDDRTGADPPGIQGW